MKTVMREQKNVGGCRLYITARARSIAAARFARRGLGVDVLYQTTVPIIAPYKQRPVEHELGLSYSFKELLPVVPSPEYAPKNIVVKGINQITGNYEPEIVPAAQEELVFNIGELL